MSKMQGITVGLFACCLVSGSEAQAAWKLNCSPTNIQMTSKFDCDVTVTSKGVGGGTVPALAVTATSSSSDVSVSPASDNIPSPNGNGGSISFTVGCNVKTGGGTITFTGTGGMPVVTKTCRVKVTCVAASTAANNISIFKGDEITTNLTLRGMKCVTGAEVEATILPGNVPNKVTVVGMDADHSSTGDNKAPVTAGSALFKVKCEWDEGDTNSQQVVYKVPTDPGNSYDKTITVECKRKQQGCAEDAGDCGDPNGTPGCDDPECCETVCAVDPVCCEVGWDEICAGLAAELCIPTACGEAPGSCCIHNSTGGCSDAACCEQVCSQDPWCCDTQWDQPCADLALALCSPETCPQNCGLPESGDCCTAAEGTAGCDDAECCSRVCDDDPYCCYTEWDEVCADVASGVCLVCTGPPDCTGQAGDCCTEHETPGCDDPDCCAVVCAEDSYCCEVEWDGLCAEEAGTLCPDCPAPPMCGDGVCEAGEDCENCPEDCGCAAGQQCVNGECVSIIPTVSEWGLIVMALLLLTAGTIVFARRRRPAVA